MAVFLTVALPLAGSAQSQLDTAQAQAFLGNWTVAIQSDMGPFQMDLTVVDSSGKVAVTMGSEQLPAQSVTDVTRDAENLILRFTVDAQGTPAPVIVTLRPNAEQGLAVTMDFAAGAFVATGTATRKPAD
jgi:lipopolysaccharide export system protein LptA